MKKTTYYILGILTAISLSVYAKKITEDNLKLGVEGTADPVQLEFDVNDGATNPKVVGDNGTMEIQDAVIQNSEFGSNDIDLGTASNTSKLRVSRETSANLNALTREVGSVYYDSDQASLVVDDGTDLRPVGSGASGAGEINYASNGDALVNTDGWTPSGTLTITRSEDPSDLPREGAVSTAFVLSSGSVSDYVETCAPIGVADRNKKLKVEAAYINEGAEADFVYEVSSFTNDDCTGTETALNFDGDLATQTQQPIGAGNGVATGTFDFSDGLSARVRIVRLAGSSDLNFTNFIVGPGKPALGFGGWTTYDETQVTIGGGTGSTFGEFMPYKTQNGKWRLAFNLATNVSSAISGSITISGIVADNSDAAFRQTVAVSNNTNTTGEGFISANTNSISWYAGSASTNIRISGDIALDGRPAWAVDTNTISLYQEDNLQTYPTQSLSFDNDTPTLNAADMQRVGPNLIIFFDGRWSASTTGIATFTLPFGLTSAVDSVQASDTKVVGHWWQGNQITNPAMGTLTVDSSDNTKILFQQDQTDYVPNTGQGYFGFYAIIPIQGWQNAQNALVGGLAASATNGGLVSTDTTNVQVLGNGDKSIQGNLGVGTAIPDETLDVDGNIEWANGSDTAVGLLTNISNNAVVQSKTTNLYFGISGDAFALILQTGEFRPNTDGGITLGDVSQRWGQIYSTSASISTSSDLRLKTNVKELSGGLEKILSLKPKHWDWKYDYQGETTGFIAQDLEKTWPELVSTSDANYKDVDNIKTVKTNGNEMIATLVNAIQEQQDIIEELTARLEALENQ